MREEKRTLKLSEETVAKNSPNFLKVLIYRSKKFNKFRVEQTLRDVHLDTFKFLKDKYEENFKNIKIKRTHNVQEKNKQRYLLIRNNRGQKAMKGTIQSAKRKTVKPRITHPVKLSLKNKRKKIKSTPS